MGKPAVSMGVMSITIGRHNPHSYLIGLELIIVLRTSSGKTGIIHGVKFITVMYYTRSQITIMPLSPELLIALDAIRAYKEHLGNVSLDDIKFISNEQLPWARELAFRFVSKF